MKIVSTSYSKTQDYSCPSAWLDRIDFYTGILEALAKDHKVDSIERIHYEGNVSKNGVDYHFMMFEKPVVRFPWRMHTLIRHLQPDVVLVNGMIFPLQLIQLRLALGRRPRIIVLHRSEKPFNGFKKRLQAVADQCVNAYLFASTEFGEQWIANGNISKRKAVIECIPASSVFNREGKSAARRKLEIDGSPVYLWAGRLEKNKDPLTVVRGFITFQRMHPAVRLYMIFQSEELLEDVKAIINTSDASGNIHLVGKVAHSDMQSWFSAADFVISGSHYEGGGIAIVEAMSCGCIPLLTDIVSFRRLAAGCGLVYEAGNADALMKTLEQSLSMGIAEHEMKVLKKFSEELSFTAIAKKIDHHLVNEVA